MTNVTPLRNLCEKALAKLEESGLSPSEGAELGMYSVPDASKLHKSFAPVRALVIPYDRDAGLGGFYRIRYLESPPKTFRQHPVGKYSQPPGSGVEAYFPDMLDWEAIAHNVNEPIIFTEGELKAACACARDFTTIGLGGVYNFKTKDTDFLPSLEAFDWNERDVFIAYDSDAGSNAHVHMAMGRLTDELRERGARVRLVELPPGPRRAKVGLDDYLVAHTDEQFIALTKKARDPDPPEFFAMNEDVAYVRNIDRYVPIDKPDSALMSLSTFASSSDYASRTYEVPVINARGEGSFKTMPVIPAWVRWPRRHGVDSLTYEPGQPRLTAEGLNRWSGWGCDSIEGDIQPFLDLVDFIFEGAQPEHVEWFLDWCAYPIQNPGAKLMQAVLVHGPAQGTGKTLLGSTIGRIYGDNFYTIGTKQLHSDFNSWAHYRQFIVGDEISTGDSRRVQMRTKEMITQESVTINIKNQPTFAVRDRMNYYFTSNHSDALYITTYDRRFFIHEVMHDKPRPRLFYKNVVRWAEDGGAAHLRHWFENRAIASTFSPGMAAPRTRARQDMVQDSASDLGLWCMELKNNPGNILFVGQLKHQRDLFTANELLALYWRDHDQGHRTTVNGMTRALKDVGFKHVNGGETVRIGEMRLRYFAIRNVSKWLSPPPKIKVEAWLRMNIELPPK